MPSSSFYDIPSFTIKVNGKEILSTLYLLALRIDLQAQSADSAEVVFRFEDLRTEIDKELSVLKKSLPAGDKIDIALGRDGKVTPCFSGLIKRHGLTINDRGTFSIYCLERKVAVQSALKPKASAESKPEEPLKLNLMEHVIDISLNNIFNSPSGQITIFGSLVTPNSSIYLKGLWEGEKKEGEAEEKGKKLEVSSVKHELENGEWLTILRIGG